MSLKEQTLRDQLWLYAKSTIAPELAIDHMSRLVSILEHHPSLGEAWGVRADALIRDMEDILTELEG